MKRKQTIAEALAELRKAALEFWKATGIEPVLVRMLDRLERVLRKARR